MTSRLVLRSGMIALLLLSGCDDDPNTPGVQVICHTPAPQLAGTWNSSLQNQPISITVNERCVAYLFGERYWDITGQWSWSGHQGSVAGLTVSGGVELYLRMGTPPQPVSLVVLKMTTPVPITSSAMSGFASGVWRVPADTTRVVAGFDSVAITLQRP